MDKYIPLQRQFSPISRNQEDSESSEFLSAWGHSGSKSWDDLDHEYRCVILAAAGSGKTEELRHRAKVLSDQGKLSFFIRIEDIENSFWQSFDIGEETEFNTWLLSTEEAWFFLDSVDEARLDNPGDFEKALRKFARSIQQGAHRAHIYLSSRPYAWRFSEDRRFLDEILFIPKKVMNADEDKKQPAPESALTEYTMLPLNYERIRCFSEARGANDVDRLLAEIERCDLGSLAERPFDLVIILAKWAKDNVLGGRLELLRHNIEQRLRDTHNTNRAQRQPLNFEKAKEGARRLAAAVVLSGQAGLNVPDSSTNKPGIESTTVLADWEDPDIRALLDRGIFNDIIYGAVRFRHREVRELLAAEWFDSLLKSGNSRYAIESLFFREHYGEKIITPRLRPVLPWLILLDDGIRHKALQIRPEIAVEAGDPSKLPLCERQKTLNDIVRRIVANQDDRSARDNSAIARIANLDLSADVLRLIDEYQSNDEAIFFLGRLVWQGEMTSCLEPLMTIALDSSRGKYARIASARAVMTCGTFEHRQTLWQQLNEADAVIPRQLLCEIVDGVDANSNSVEQLLFSISKLEPYDQFKSTNGLEDALHKFVAKMPVDGSQTAISLLVDGLHHFLVMPPFVKDGYCQVSKAHAWLLSHATHAVERLVEIRSAAAIEATPLSIMLMVRSLRNWGQVGLNKHKDNLHVLVPNWPELNDALYWASIEQVRCRNAEKSNEPLTDELSVLWLGHFWKFDTTGFPRLLNYIRSRSLLDDRLIAVNAAFRVYIQADKPEKMLTSLQHATADDCALRDRLDMLLNPPVSEQMKQIEAEFARDQHAHENLMAQQKQDYDQWKAALCANPERIIRPENLKPGELTWDHIGLIRELRGEVMDSRQEANDWQALISDFGQAVAHAYREAAIKHWRLYMPSLQSEGAIRDNSVPYALVFAMAGLEIEAAEIADFPRHLTETEARHALRYLTWELNGFPRWFERMHSAFPEITVEAVTHELIWELENTGTDQSIHYILNRLVYDAPWLYSSIAPKILDWVSANPGRINTNQHYCLQILAKGGIPADQLAELANRELASTNDLENIARWHALIVDCDPDNGIPEVEQWLANLPKEEGNHAAQVFITALMGGRREGAGFYIGNFRTAEYLKSLYVLMHRYIQTKEGVDRTNGGDYSPSLRDDAQDSRNGLFNLITETPGKASYTVIKQLIEDHPEPVYRPRMNKLAYQRAEADGDLEAWMAKQVFDFALSQTITPTTHRQLFDLAVQRLTDLKNWLERGNDSPWETWQRAAQETEMRKLIAGWLNQKCQSQYVTAQENELANSQRMDILLQNTNVQSPVPIELKLLDKNWNGPDLCERLRNQLAGDYLREESAGCGVFLLVAQKIEPKKRWKVNGRNVLLPELADALIKYWDSISSQFPGVLAIDVIIIDLAQRGRVSDS